MDCLNKSNPLDENCQERILEDLRVYAIDFYHESWLGAPDEQTPYKEMGLESKEEIEEFILDWCETNPVSAMRCYYPIMVLKKQ